MIVGGKRADIRRANVHDYKTIRKRLVRPHVHVRDDIFWFFFAILRH